MRHADAVARLAMLPARLPSGPDSLMPVFADGRARPSAALGDPAEDRAAAVLVLVAPDRHGDAVVILTERPDYDGHHAREVSFPGGKAEPDDPHPEATALREASEEIGLDPEAAGVRIVGRLDELRIPVSRFRLTPVLAVAARRPLLAPDPIEVARILEVSLDAFLPDAPIEVVEQTVRGWPLRYGGYRIDGLHVWGATARILGQLGALVARPRAGG